MRSTVRREPSGYRGNAARTALKAAKEFKENQTIKFRKAASPVLAARKGWAGGVNSAIYFY